jgi:hypothetical protein
LTLTPPVEGVGRLDKCTVVALDKARARDQIDAVVALAMAVEAVERQPAPVKLLGWL